MKKYYCECGCGQEVSIFRGKPRRFIYKHHSRTEKQRKMHSKRMIGNTLYSGRIKPKSAREIISKKQRGEGNSMWNNGRTIAGGGYISLWKPDHPFADVNGRIKEERLVMEAHIGRYLKKEEIIHHINHNRQDNRIENLMIMSKHDHSSYHAFKRWENAKRIKN
jgi:hypothetical protein